MRGIIEIKRNGSGYLILDGAKDIFVHRKNISNAMNGDTVRISLQKHNSKLEGKVIEIIERKQSKFIGILEVSEKYAHATNIKGSSVDFFIPLEKLNGAVNGDKCLVEMTKWRIKDKNPYGKVLQVFGQNLENETEMNSIMYEYGFEPNFEPEVEDEANQITFDISDEEIKKRRDMRDTYTLTIDPETAKDFDDAISIKQLRDDGLNNPIFEIGIHIADVTHYVKENSEIEKEAYNRATSVYLVDRCVPMLPEHLSNGVCSLRPHEDKLAYSVVFEMDMNGKITKEWFGRTVIHSDHRYTYESAQEVVDKHKDFDEKFLPNSEEMWVVQLNNIAKNMRKNRDKIEFTRVEHKFILDENKVPIGISLKESMDTNKLIEEFMLLANKQVSKYLAKNPSVYRTHDIPNKEKLTEFVTFIKKFGYNFNMGNPKEIMKSMNQLMKDIKDKPEESLISTLAVRTMSKAKYETDNIGHYGLDFKYYTHFTSPIRRYPDMMVHRLLTRKLKGGTPYKEDDLETKCEHSSLREISASRAERDSIKYKQAEYLQNHIGERFEAIITGIMDWGVYAEIVENKCEGLIRRDDLSDNGMEIFADEYKIVGSLGRLTLGDTISVVVKDADLFKKQIDLTI